MLDQISHFVTGLYGLLAIEINQAVDLRRIGVASADRAFMVHFIDQHFQRTADFLLQTRRGNFLLHLHKTVVALLLNCLVYRDGELVGRRTFQEWTLKAPYP